MVRYTSRYRKKQTRRFFVAGGVVFCIAVVLPLIAVSGIVKVNRVDVIAPSDLLRQSLASRFASPSLFADLWRLRGVPTLFAVYPELKRVRADVWLLNRTITVTAEVRQPYLKICGVSCVFADADGTLFERALTQEKLDFTTGADFSQLQTVPRRILDAVAYFDAHAPDPVRGGDIRSNGDIVFLTDAYRLLVDPSLPLADQYDKLKTALRYLEDNAIQFSQIDVRIPQKIFYQ